MIQSNAPFFTNDLTGFIKIVIAFGSIASAMVFTLIKISDKKSTEDVKELRNDLNGVGTRLNNMEINAEKAHAEIRTDIKSIHSTLEGYQREQLQMIMDLGKAQNAEVHKVDKQVGILMERSNLVDCINQLGAQIAKAIKEK